MSCIALRLLKWQFPLQVRIRVLRNGENAFVPVKQIVVGDVVHLETGDKIVADGVFISGASACCVRVCVRALTRVVSSQALL